GLGRERASGRAALSDAVVPLPAAVAHAASRLRPLVEERAARVVLEPGQRAALTRLELALEQHVADHPSLARDGVQREQAHAGQLVAALVAVEAAEKLVAAGDGQETLAALDRP